MFKHLEDDENFQQLVAVAKGQETDRIPYDLCFASDFTANFYGIREREYYMFPEKMVEAQKAVVNRFCKKNRYIATIFSLLRPDPSVVAEIAAVAPLRWPPDGSPFAQPIVKKPEDIDDLQLPDFERDGLFPYIYELVDWLFENYGDDYFIGPCEPRGAPQLATMVRGTNEFLVDLRLRPKLAHKVLDFCTEVIIGFLKQLKARIGEHFFICVADDAGGFLNTKQYEQFGLPYNKRIFDFFEHPLNTYHNDADTTQILEFIPKLGCHIFNPGDKKTCDLVKAKELLQGKVAIYGNVPPYDILQLKGPSEIEAAVKEVVDQAGAGGGLILSTGGVISRGTPPENLDALLNAFEIYGATPPSD